MAFADTYFSQKWLASFHLDPQNRWIELKRTTMTPLSDIRLGIIGLGYVGLPLAVEFGKTRSVLGFDINPKRVDELSLGHDLRSSRVWTSCKSWPNTMCRPMCTTRGPWVQPPYARRARQSMCFTT